MTKMPKNLSLSRSKSTNLANKNQDWQHRTSPRSGTSIIRSMVDSGPREPGRIEDSPLYKRDETGKIVLKNGQPIEEKPKTLIDTSKAIVKKIKTKQFIRNEDGSFKRDEKGNKILKNPFDSQIEVILKRIKREQNRLKKAKAYGTPPVGRETQESRDRQAFIVRKEQVINKLMFTLSYLNAEKQKFDKREIKKFQDSPKSSEFIGVSEAFVKLERGKVVPKKETVLIQHRNSGSIADKVKKYAQESKSEAIKKKYSQKIQEDIDKVFVPRTEPLSEEEFERIFNGEDE